MHGGRVSPISNWRSAYSAAPFPFRLSRQALNRRMPSARSASVGGWWSECRHFTTALNVSRDMPSRYNSRWLAPAWSSHGCKSFRAKFGEPPYECCERRGNAPMCQRDLRATSARTSKGGNHLSGSTTTFGKTGQIVTYTVPVTGTVRHRSHRRERRYGCFGQRGVGG